MVEGLEDDEIVPVDQVDQPMFLINATRTEYTAIGTVVNLAARVCAIAPGEQILVTNRVHSAVEERVTANALGDVEFKGISRPVPIYEVVALRG